MFSNTLENALKTTLQVETSDGTAIFIKYRHKIDGKGYIRVNMEDFEEHISRKRNVEAAKLLKELVLNRFTPEQLRKLAVEAYKWKRNDQ
jgi:hypothetical protein